MAAGFRGPGAIWAGGAAAKLAPRGGFRSLLAPWLGGAAARPRPPRPVGFRGLHAIWLGGAAAIQPSGPPEPPTIEIQRPSGGALMSWHLARQISRRRRVDEDEALLLAVLK